MGPNSEEKGRLRSIDFLRGVAAVGVVLFHASIATAYGSKNQQIQNLHRFFAFGSLGVPLFFVISGFCIHRKQAEMLLQGKYVPISFARYWRRRFVRLYPSYFVACVFSAFCTFIALYYRFGRMYETAYPGEPYVYLALDLLTHLLMIHCFFSYFDDGLNNGALWTLAREEQYYLLYFPLLKMRELIGLSGCMMVGVISSYLMLRWAELKQETNPDVASIIRSSSLTYWPQWILGMVGVEMMVGLIPARLLVGNRVLGMSGLAVVLWQFEAARSGYFVQFLLYGVGFFLVVLALSGMEREGRWVRSGVVRVFERIGGYSYSLYLIHTPFMALFGKYARTWGAGESVPRYFAALVCLFLIVQIPALMLFNLVERQGMVKRVHGETGVNQG